MGRRDAVQFFLELAEEWRRLGAEVTFEPGWERRGNGMSPDYEGGVVHHTAFLSSFQNPFPARATLLNGRTGLPGPLCNVAGPVCPVDRPRLHIMAAFPANHAGASGGRSMGPLPVTTLFNRYVVGLEVDYAGLTPMIGGQRRASLIFTRGLANVLNRSVEYIRAHAETSVTGKWDIGYAEDRTYDMAAFRREAAALTPSTSSSSLGDTVSVAIAVAPNKTCWIADDHKVWWTTDIKEVEALCKLWRIPVVPMADAEIQKCIDFTYRRKAESDAQTAAAVAKVMPVPDVDETALANELFAKLAPKLDEAVPLSAEQMQEMLDNSEIDTVNLLAARIAA